MDTGKIHQANVLLMENYENTFMHARSQNLWNELCARKDMM